MISEIPSTQIVSITVSTKFQAQVLDDIPVLEVHPEKVIYIISK